MFAVIETGGKQYRVTEGEVVFLERLDGEPGDLVLFDKILSCSNGEETEFGQPYLDDASVEGKILGHGKNKKIVVFKYKAKKGYRKKQGHRQPYTKIRVERIISEKYGIAAYAGDDEEEAETAAGVDTATGIDAAAGIDAATGIDAAAEAVGAQGAGPAAGEGPEAIVESGTGDFEEDSEAADEPYGVDDVIAADIVDADDITSIEILDGEDAAAEIIDTDYEDVPEDS